tara:strand:- start:858 stop:1094 length:237 start_codon:yes stop_codon:yes gene_type:complete
MYLIYASEEAAIERADEEGKDNNFSYWTEGKGTRWLTTPVPTADGMWALDVSEYDLDDLEETSTVDSFPPPYTIEDTP